MTAWRRMQPLPPRLIYVLGLMTLIYSLLSKNMVVLRSVYILLALGLEVASTTITSISWQASNPYGNTPEPQYLLGLQGY